MEFSENQRLFLTAICTYFYTEGKWPTYGYLDHVLRNHDDLDVEIVGQELDEFMYDGPHAPVSGWDPQRSTYLSISALYRCVKEGIYPDLAQDLDAFMDVVHLCIEKYRAGEDNARITEAEVRDRYTMDDFMLRKVFHLMQPSGLWRTSNYDEANPGEPVNWAFTVAPTIRKYRRVSTILDFIVTRANLLRQTGIFQNGSSADMERSFAKPESENSSDTTLPVDGLKVNQAADVDDRHEYLWDGTWQTTHHRITIGDDLPVVPEDSEGNAVSRLIHQFVSLLAVECERRGKRLEEMEPFGSFSYVAVVTSSLVEAVFGRSVNGRYAIHRDLRSQNAELPIEDLEGLARQKMGWQMTATLSLPASLVKQIAYDRQASIETHARQLAEKLLATQSTATLPSTVEVRPIDLFPHGPFSRNERLCFVLMPFASEMRPVYDNAIVPAATYAHLECLRADEIFKPGGIMAQVWQKLMEARVVIADLTNMNANVFYELGLAHTIGHDVILLTQNIKWVPFDLRHMRCIEYRLDQSGLRLLEQKLRAAIREVLVVPS